MRSSNIENIPMESSLSVRGVIDRASFIETYRRNRVRSKMLFDLLAPDTYYSQPISLRHPIVFYEGHLPAFSFNTLVKKGLGGASIDPRLEQLFARGIDPSEDAVAAGKRYEWPARDAVQAFADEADRRVIDALEHGVLDRQGDPLLDRAEAVFAILEHEAMHQETLLYMWHRLPFEGKARPRDYTPRVDGSTPAQAWIEVPRGLAALGVDRDAVPFSWDNERPSRVEAVEDFAVDRHDVTNDAFMEFVAAGGYTDERWWRGEDFAWVQREHVRHPLFWEQHGDRWYWRGMFDLIPLPPSWPVYVSFAEAAAFARWRGARLPSEAEFQRAAYGAADDSARPFPWGDAEPTAGHGVFDFSSWDPQPAGSHPAGRSAWGVEDLVGNGWEWTASPFAPFPGFRPIGSYPEYSADFFDGDHFVMKGASPATARELIRPTFRNWFRAHYPYVYATFRCARLASRA
jgi:ergothioneine biosynthesis protein EgtB